MKRKIAFFTGTRAEYGLLRGVIREAAPLADAWLLVSGAHLSKAHGATVSEIERDSLAPLEKIDIDLSDNSPRGVAASTGRAVALLAASLERRRPDLLVCLGDRYETFAAASAAAIMNVPIAHLYGGEITEGAIDNALRHAVTKLAHLHFVSCAKYRDRVIQMGEAPERVWIAGALGVENARNVRRASEEETRKFLGLPPDSPYVIVTWHPATLSDGDPTLEAALLLDNLRAMPGLYYVFTGANADAGGAAINEFLQAEAKGDPRMRFFMSLGMERYIQAARFSSGVAGNSSSALCEIPGMGVPSLDIGVRQKGRERASSVFHCEVNKEDIGRGLRLILSPEGREAGRLAKNPFERPRPAKTVAKVLLEHPLEGLLAKHFYEQA